MSNDCKTLYFIAGPNGAGKTTASMKILPAILDCEEFVNADEIARGLSPFHPESVAIEAGRLQLERIDQLLSRGVNFSIETTLATKSYVSLVHKAKAQGYTVKLFFFWLPSEEMAIERVERRVLEGGHSIPEETIRRRYKAGVRNLFERYIPIVDSWQLHSNADSEIQMIAFKENGQTVILDPETFHKIESYAKRI